MSAATRAARRVGPVCFTMVMATGIVSAALRLAGLRDLAGALLAIAAACFVILAAASCWRATLFPARPLPRGCWPSPRWPSHR